MNRIREWLYIGNYRETRNQGLLDANRIGAVLQLAEPVAYPHISSLYLPVEDGEPLDLGLLRQGLDFVLEHRQRGAAIIIACGAGVSRSASFATAALKEAEGIPLLQAVQEVKRAHAPSFPHMALWESLCAYYGEATPFLTMFRLLEAISPAPGSA